MRAIYFFLFEDKRVPKFLNAFAGTPYNHVAVALDPDLREMYGFLARNGGKVVKEDLKYFPPGNCQVLEKEVSEEQYLKLREYLRAEKGREYRYNYVGVVVQALVLGFLYHVLHIKAPRWVLEKLLFRPDVRTCGSFVGLALEHAGIKFDPVPGIPGTYTPYLVTCSTFRRPELLGMREVFRGDAKTLRERLKGGVKLAPDLVGTGETRKGLCPV